MSDCNVIGDRIEKLRKRNNNETQAQLAKALHVKRETVNQWENGTRDLKTQYTIALAKHFNTTCDYLLGVADDETNEIDTLEVIQRTGLSKKALDNIRNAFSMQLSTEAQKAPYFYKHSYRFILNTLFENDLFRQFVFDAETLSRTYTSLRDSYSHEQIVSLYNDELEQKFNFKVYRVKETLGRMLISIIERQYAENIDHEKLDEFLSANPLYTKRAEDLFSNGKWIYDQPQPTEGDENGQHNETHQ